MSARRVGYTLVELVVVMVILALAAALAVPAMAAWRPTSDADAAAARISATLQLARERAVTRGREMEVVFDVPNRRVWLGKHDTSFVLALPDGCQLVGAARSVIRFAAGGPSQGEVPSVTCGAHRRRVDADPLTGLPRVTEAP